MAKFFVKVTKAYQDNQGDWFVQGVASGTLEDRDEQRMNRSVVEDFAKALPMPLTDSHPRAGEILGELGQVIDAQVLDDEYDSLYVKAKLDKSHPAVPYMMEQIGKGKRYAFSIEGTDPVTKTVWSDRLGKMITEFVKVVPKAISITTEPSYIPSYMEFVEKSYKESIKNSLKVAQVETNVQNDNQLNSENTLMKDKKERVKEVKETEQPKPDETEVSETQTQEETPEVKPDAEVKTEPDQETSKESTEQVEEPEEEDVEKSVQSAVSADKKQGDDALSMLKSMMSRMEALDAQMAKLCESVKCYEEKTTKSIAESETVLKSFHDDIENLKDLPLQKKSRVVSKNFDTRKEEDKPTTLKDIVQNMLD